MAVSGPELASRPPGAARRGHHPAVALAVIAASQLMVILDATIVNIALPQIQQALGFSTTDLSWVLNAYTLTFGGLLLLGGRAGDILGRRRVFIAGILIFTLASFLGGLATSAGWLLAARALQGVGGAIAAPTALALITTNFAEGPERNRAFGVFGAVAGAGGALGLLAGGMLTSWLSWRWVLFVNVPIGVLLAALTPLYITESKRHPGTFDLGGALTSTAGMTALVYGFIRAAQEGWSDPGTLGLVRRRRDPAGRVPVDRDQDPPAHHPAAPVPPTATGPAATRSCWRWPRPCSACSSSSPCSCRTCWATARCGPASRSSRVTATIIVSSQFAARSLPRLGAKRLMITGALLAVAGLAWLTQVSVTSGVRRRPARPHAGVRPGHGPAVPPPHRRRRRRRPTP